MLRSIFSPLVAMSVYIIVVLCCYGRDHTSNGWPALFMWRAEVPLHKQFKAKSTLETASI